MPERYSTEERLETTTEATIIKPLIILFFRVITKVMAGMFLQKFLIPFPPLSLVIFYILLGIQLCPHLMVLAPCRRGGV